MREENRIHNLQNRMEKEGIDFVLMPMCDYHSSEYIGDYFKTIRYYTGFTGSAAFVVMTQTRTYLWTDGRYFLQAEKELLGKNITLMKQGEENVPTVIQFLTDYIKNAETKIRISFDGRLFAASFFDRLASSLEKLNLQEKVQLSYETDLAGLLWEEDASDPRPSRSSEKIWILKENFAGESAKDKISKIRTFLEEQKADLALFTSLDEIAYLLNLRGRDVAFTPVFLAYLILEKEAISLYVQTRALCEETKTYLEQLSVTICEYDSFYQAVNQKSENKTLFYDPKSANYLLKKMIAKSCKTYVQDSPVLLMKAVKNDTEIANEKLAHRKDGVAVTKFIYWLKTKVRTGLEEATELTAAKKIISLRKENEHYVDESFTPIIAYKEHGSIVHYSPKEETNVPLLAESFLLADTGGHYLEGTTDITRTIVMGALSDQEKQHYTAVLVGNLRLMNAKFKASSQGANLDYIAREPLYRLGLDFNHGTGHGVGYLLNVHEGPNAFRQKFTEGAMLQKGMITSDEPGYYEDDQYGIRLENLILCVEAEKTKYGQFLGFEPLTMVPFDLEAVEKSCMTEEDLLLLNRYHKQVYETISPYLTKEEQLWLMQETRELKRDEER